MDEPILTMVGRHAIYSAPPATEAVAEGETAHSRTMAAKLVSITGTFAAEQSAIDAVTEYLTRYPHARFLTGFSLLRRERGHFKVEGWRRCEAIRP